MIRGPLASDKAYIIRPEASPIPHASLLKFQKTEWQRCPKSVQVRAQKSFLSRNHISCQGTKKGQRNLTISLSQSHK